MSTQLALDVDPQVVDRYQTCRRTVESAIRAAALTNQSRISPNAVRAILSDYDVPGYIVGQVYRSMRCAGEIAYDGLTEISDDVAGGNAGKIHRTYVWVGGAV